MTKILNQIIFFFPPPTSEYFFQQHWESEYFFRKKTITPPFKLNGRSLSEEIGKPNNKSCCEPSQKKIIVFKQIG
jgi:hypothetical protein